MNGIIAVKFLNALIIFSVLFLYLAKSINGEQDSYSDPNYGEKRQQSPQITGLKPFPRIGRAYQRSWKSRILEQIKRREGLIPFPRVGRSGKPAGVKLPAEILLTGLDSRSVRNLQRQSPDFEDRWIATVLKDYMLPIGELNDENVNQNEIDDEVPDLQEARKESLMMQRLNN